MCQTPHSDPGGWQQTTMTFNFFVTVQDKRGILQPPESPFHKFLFIMAVQTQALVTRRLGGPHRLMLKKIVALHHALAQAQHADVRGQAFPGWPGRLLPAARQQVSLEE